jgi:alkylation response protein AidB-like acyl-CoA dehydrogenase
MMTDSTTLWRPFLWRFHGRADLQYLAESARTVARDSVARLVADGGRRTHLWTPSKAELLAAFESAGLDGGFPEDAKNLAIALVAFELSWVDAGAATSCLAGHLALAPIAVRGTPAQREQYLRRSDPPRHGAFVLTEPIPFAGVETGSLDGKVRIAHWTNGDEPFLDVDKRGRFITNNAFADFAVVAVDSADPRIKGSCMIVIESTDPGTFDPGTPTRKLVHQLSATGDPIYAVRVPASRIVGGYRIKDGALVPRYSHAELIEAVFRRTRVTVGLMTAGKLLSIVEPIRQHLCMVYPHGVPEDARRRLLDIRAMGEAAAVFGFAAARLFDELEPWERRKDEIFTARGIEDPRAQFRVLMQTEKDAVACVRDGVPSDDPLVQFLLRDTVANVFCPAVKLWNTGHGATMLREAVSLFGEEGITEDCPGFPAWKWFDTQLEATYEGPESVQRRQLTLTMATKLFRAIFQKWTDVLAAHPAHGAGALAAAMDLWSWTLDYLQHATDMRGHDLYHSTRQGVTFPMADAMSWLLAARQFLLDTRALACSGNFTDAARLLTDLAHVQAVRASGEVSRICADLVFGYCVATGETVPSELTPFIARRNRLNEAMAGVRIAKDRAASSEAFLA